MLLRLRVALPDRPGSLGRVAHTLGVAGADIVNVAVLERLAGRAVDDVAVRWPVSAPVDRIVAGLAAIAGVRVEGMWRSREVPGPCGDVTVVGQVAANPAEGVAILVDAAPAVIGADWAAALVVGAEWAGHLAGPGPGVVYASWQAPEYVDLPGIAPLRPRAVSVPGGPHYAVAPLGRAGLVLIAARETGGAGEAGDAPRAPAFHRSEIDRFAHLVGVVAAIMADRIDRLAVPPPRDAGEGGAQARPPR